ncbi:pectate lyase [Candidatus Poribacteria bacterium]|nr:pectate lyase [Candidatus Poribacteria bacterium]
MSYPKRSMRTAYVLLGVSSALWALALLFLFRVSDVFHAVLMKWLGPFVLYPAMTLLPLAALAIAVRALRRGATRALSIAVAGIAALSLLASVFVIVIPLIGRALDPEGPKNPSTPRPIPPQTGIPVFPGAEGFGTRTVAGRGGRIVHVTTLADSGPGSLREALLQPYPRIVVFRVSGIIELTRSLFVSEPFVTVAGQTAPGDGICIKNAGVVITAHDVLIQHLRIRPGNEGDVDADTNDAVEVLGAHNVVLDHLSTGWSEDETIGLWQGAHDVTVSWSVVAEALNRSRHRKKTHSAGLLIGDGSYHASIHHNLFAHNDFRNPLIGGGGTHDVVNNVIYDWGALATEIVDTNSNSFVNIVGNRYLRGPSTPEGAPEIVIGETRSVPQLYVAGNLGIHRNLPSENEWSLVRFGWGEQPSLEPYRRRTPFDTPAVTSVDADSVLELVLSGAGAAAPQRDAVDARIVQEVRARTGRIIDHPGDVGGYPRLVSAAPPVDADGDGMPDAWETMQGLNPRDASDGAGDQDGDGYTNVEEYLHSLSP